MIYVKSVLFSISQALNKFLSLSYQNISTAVRLRNNNRKISKRRPITLVYMAHKARNTLPKL